MDKRQKIEWLAHRKAIRPDFESWSEMQLDEHKGGIPPLLTKGGLASLGGLAIWCLVDRSCEALRAIKHDERE